SDVDIRVESERLVAHAVLDIDQLKSRMPPTSGFNPLSYLSGRLPVELRSRFPNSDGFGTLELEDVKLGGYTIPSPFRPQLVLSARRNADTPEGFDIRSPFRLPYAVKRMRLQSGKVLLDL